MSAPSLTRTRVTLNRRQVLRLGLAAAGALQASRAWATPPRRTANATSARRGLGDIGPLGAPDANGLRLPAGFASRIVARSRVAPVAGRPFLWHDSPDGGAVFAAPGGGWIYVSNSEVAGNLGGASALRFSATGDVIDAYPILSGTNINCAGGPTPWGTWLSCEEHAQGLVWECDPLGRKPARSWPALGTFTHEAVAVDPVRMQLYLTEDMPDGRWYRFTPVRAKKNVSADLSAGRLEAAEYLPGSGGRVRWHEIADPSAKQRPTRWQAIASSSFDGGEGCWHATGKIYFSTKGDNRVWSYDIARGRLSVIYDASAFKEPVLKGVDNVTVTAGADVLVAEDEDDMQIVAITPERRVVPVVQVVGHPYSEVAGPAFDPSGTRLYFSSQRGATGSAQDGVTFEVTGPFNG
jgi:secreted PhoX family phosphatase